MGEAKRNPRPIVSDSISSTASQVVLDALDAGLDIEDIAPDKGPKIRGEARFNPFIIRAGYGNYGSPFKENNEYKTESYNLGLGVDLGKMFLDVSYSRVISQYEDRMYDGSEIINIDEERNRLLGTIGFRF